MKNAFDFDFFLLVFLHFGGAEEDMAARLSLVVISFSFFLFSLKDRNDILNRSVMSKLFFVFCRSSLFSFFFKDRS